MTFNNMMLAISAGQNSQLKKNITFPSSSLGFARIHSNGNLIAYSIDSQLYVLNASSNYSLVTTYNHSSNIYDISILAPYYVFIMNNCSILQYDIEINQTVHVVDYPPVPETRLDLLASKWLFAYKNSSSSDHSIDIF